MTRVPRGEARARLIEAGRSLVRRHGFAATSVDDLCAAAGVTKGAFFHHFASKEALGVALVRDWTETTGAMFAAHPYNAAPDPLDRVFAYIDLRRSLLDMPLPEFTCVAGTTVQETYLTAPAIRARFAAPSPSTCGRSPASAIPPSAGVTGRPRSKFMLPRLAAYCAPPCRIAAGPPAQ